MFAFGVSGCFQDKVPPLTPQSRVERRNGAKRVFNAAHLRETAYLRISIFDFDLDPRFEL